LDELIVSDEIGLNVMNLFG